MAELDLSEHQRRSLRQPLPDRVAVEGEATASAHRCSDQTRRIDWRFTTADARTRNGPAP